MGDYSNPNFRCATKGCGHFVADHTWTTAESDRGACHANGTGCTCQAYVDSGKEEL